MTKYTWYQKARLQAIEVLSYWQGRINTRDIMEIFGISRQIAQKDMGEYINLAPGNLSYQKSDRTYVATSIFKPLITQGQIEEYLALKTDGVDFIDSPHLVYVAKPRFDIDPVKFRRVILGIHEGRKLKVRYQSLNHPEGLQREILPLKLVYSGFRWHLRAFCLLRNDYRDFSLARLMNEPVVMDTFNQVEISNGDVLWNEFVTLVFSVNTKLAKEEIRLIENEFGFKRGVLKVQTRKALINYTLQNYQVTVHGSELQPRRDRLVLDNVDDVEALIW